MGKCEKQIRMNGSFYFENSSKHHECFHCFDSCVYSIVLLLLFLLLQIVVIRCILFGCTFSSEWLVPDSLYSMFWVLSNRRTWFASHIFIFFSETFDWWCCILPNELHTFKCYIFNFNSIFVFT